jgi:transcriptional regulator with XRE-family HTH domain
MPSDDQDLAESVAERFRALRLERGFTLETLASHSGLHRTSLGLIERGERRLTLTSAKRIADALQVPLWQVVRSAELRTELR